MTKQLANASASTRGVGLICLGAGVFILAVAGGAIAVPSGSVHAPHWLLGCVGFVFLFTGILAGRWISGNRMNTAVAAALLTLFAVVGGWVAIFGQSDGFSVDFGGHETSLAASAAWPARAVFGFGALVTSICAAFTWRKVFRQQP
ncbi:MAG: hypothetical protein M3O26_20965 [Pseudomonadota bacterium]|nr:hypothetical protein [Pseudomonadota bacterium]